MTIQFQKREGDVKPEDLKKTFGFSSVRFDLTFYDSEITEGCNMIYDTFMLLAELTNLPPKAMSLGGKMSCVVGGHKFGSKSTKAEYSATYKQLSFMTKEYFKHIAHEWMHGLDNYLYDTFVDDGNGSWMSDKPYTTKFKGRYEIKMAFGELHGAIEKSEYRRSCKQYAAMFGNGKYWLDPSELQSRAFEVYIFNLMTQKGISNKNLVDLINSKDLYPQWERDHEIMEAFDGLFKAFRFGKIDKYDIETLNGTINL